MQTRPSHRQDNSPLTFIHPAAMQLPIDVSIRDAKYASYAQFARFPSKLQCLRACLIPPVLWGHR